MTEIINWEALFELTRPQMPKDLGMWSKFAQQYDGFSKLEMEHTRQQIAMMQLDPGDTALDIGCGPGRITVPVASRVKSVTALDVSPDMLACCQRNATEAGLSNVNCVQMRWEDIVPAESLPVHDVVIASRSPAMQDLTKVNALAGKRVYLLTFAGSSLKNFHDELMDGVTESPKPPPMPRGTVFGPAMTFNRLYAMGIDANLQYVKDGFTRWYPSREAAYEDLQWLDVPEDKQARFRENVNRFIFPEKNGFRLLKETRTVIIWWEKGQ